MKSSLILFIVAVFWSQTTLGQVAKLTARISEKVDVDVETIERVVDQMYRELVSLMKQENQIFLPDLGYIVAEHF